MGDQKNIKFVRSINILSISLNGELRVKRIPSDNFCFLCMYIIMWWWCSFAVLVRLVAGRKRKNI